MTMMGRVLIQSHGELHSVTLGSCYQLLPPSVRKPHRTWLGLNHYDRETMRMCGLTEIGEMLTYPMVIQAVSKCD